MGAMTLVGLVLSVGIPLGIVVTLLIVLRRPLLNAAANLPRKLGRRSRRVVTVAVLAWLLGLGLFLGFVGAAVIGATAPQTIAFAAEMACDGTVDHETLAYSYKPGQRGTSQEWTCTTASGESTRIVGITYLYAALVFSAGSVALLVGLCVLVWVFLWRRRPKEA